MRLVLTLLFCTSLYYVVSAQQCNNVGGLQTFYDPTCAQGGIGCNAGGQNNCRFCGFDIYPTCPSNTPATQPTTKTTGSTTTKAPTSPTTKKSTTSKPDSGSDSGSGSGSGNCGCSGNRNEEEEGEWIDGEKLIFSDEFEKFDMRRWKHDLTMSGGGNWEFQLYHNNRTNSFVKDGALHLHPTLTADRIGDTNLRSNFRMDMWGGSIVDQCTGNNFYGCERLAGAGGNIINPIQSAKVTTQTSFSFKYGRMEVRAKMPEGDWLWPAIWLLPIRNQYGMWPASGEIDVVESRGNVNYPQSAGGGVQSFGSTLHWGVDWSQNRYPLTTQYYHHNEKLSEEFHTYGLYWNKDRLYTYIDDPDNIVLDVDMSSQTFFDRGDFAQSYENPWKDVDDVNAPFNQEFYIIFNLAVGGTGGYFKDGAGGKPWSDQSSNAVNDFYSAKGQWYQTWNNQPDLQIDSVKVWAFEDSTYTRYY